MTGTDDLRRLLVVDLKNQYPADLNYSNCGIKNPVLAIERHTSDQGVDFFISITFELHVSAKKRDKEPIVDYHQRYLRSVELKHNWAGLPREPREPQQFPKQGDDATYKGTITQGTTVGGEVGTSGPVPSGRIYLSHNKETAVESNLEAWDFTNPVEKDNLIWLWKSNHKTAAMTPEKTEPGSLVTLKRHVIVRRQISLDHPKVDDEHVSGAKQEKASAEDEMNKMGPFIEALDTPFKFSVTIGVNERHGPIAGFFRRLGSVGRRARCTEHKEEEKQFYLAKKYGTESTNEAVSKNEAVSTSALCLPHLPSEDTITLPHGLAELADRSRSDSGGNAWINESRLPTSEKAKVWLLNKSSDRE